MKKLSFLLITASFLTLQAMSQDDGKGKVGTAINKAGNKTAHVAVSGASSIKDKKHATKVGPKGQTIYINKNDHYYYVNARGKKVYVSAAQLKDKPEHHK